MGLLSGHGVQFRGCVVRVGPPSELTATTDFDSAIVDGGNLAMLTTYRGLPQTRNVLPQVGEGPEEACD